MSIKRYRGPSVLARPLRPKTMSSLWLPEVAAEAMQHPSMQRHLPEVAHEYASNEVTEAGIGKGSGERFVLYIADGAEESEVPIGIAHVSTSLNNDPTVLERLDDAQPDRKWQLGTNACYWVNRPGIERRFAVGQGQEELLADASRLVIHLGLNYAPGQPWLPIALTDTDGTRDPSYEHTLHMRPQTAFVQGWLPQYGIQDNSYSLHAWRPEQGDLPHTVQPILDDGWQLIPAY